MRELIQRTIDRRGTQYPNPAVGAMVIKEDRLISEGYHLVSGEPHAEVKALVLAGEHSLGATLLITLEPCTHKGQTPPCIHAIIESGVRRVIWAIDDPNPLVGGAAHGFLASHGIEVISHCMPEEGKCCLPEFHTYHALERPFVYVKAAVSLDGMIAPNSDGLHYISSPESLALVQQLRSNVQAICIGANTINVDQPRLSVRLERCIDFQPMIVIIDPKNVVDMDWVRQALDSGRSIVLFCSQAVDMTHDHLVVHASLTDNKAANWQVVLAELYHRQVHGVLVEGGSGVFRSILSAGYFDELWVTNVPQIMGQGAVPFISEGTDIPLDVSLISQAPYGVDIVVKYRNNHAFSI